MFIIDFDDTLFNTHAFKQVRLRALLKLGVCDSDYHETYVEALKNNSLSTYSNEHHADLLALRGYSKEKVLLVLEETTGERLHEFLFPDTVEFIQKLKTHNEPLILLSLGNPSFQELKVKGSGIHEYFDRTFMVTSSKVDVIQELIDIGEPEEDLWFINDKVDETETVVQRFPNIKVALKKSESIREEEYIKSNLPFFKTLAEIYEHIAQKTR